MMRRVFVLLALVASNALAQSFPAKPIRFVVPFPPGGGNDALARITSAKVSESIGQMLIVENRPGATGQTGTGYVQRQPPDGYTLVSASTPLTVTQAAGKPMPYDVLRDFTPISLLALQPNVLVVNPAFPARKLGKLIALAKAQPGKLSYAVGSPGSAPHLASELLKSMAGINIVPVPYSGGASALKAVLTGETPMAFDQAATSIGTIRAGKLRALGVTGKARAPQLPDVPTIAEAGPLPGFEVNSWFGVLAPAHLPKPIVQRLSDEFAKALRHPEVQPRLEEQGFVVVGGSADEFAAHLRNEIASVRRIFERTGITLD